MLEILLFLLFCVFPNTAFLIFLLALQINITAALHANFSRHSMLTESAGSDLRTVVGFYEKHNPQTILSNF